MKTRNHKTTMAKKKHKNKKRKRISNDKVRNNAVQGSSGSTEFFELPENISKWIPEKPNRFKIDILPFEVGGNDHPDDVEKDTIWMKMPFTVHHGIGPSNKSIVCPRSIDKRCPICEERDRLYNDDADGNTEAIKGLYAQKFVAYNIVDPENSSKVAIFCMSRGKFAGALEDELKDPDNAEHLPYFDVIKKRGRTLIVRFSEANFQGRKYLEATRIDFKKRDDMDEDDVLESTVALDTALIVKDYSEIKAMLFQEDLPDDDDEPADEATTEVDDDEADTIPFDNGDDDNTDNDSNDDDDDDVTVVDDDDNSNDDDDDDDDDDSNDEATCPECDDKYDADDAEHSDTLDKDFCSKKCLRRAEKKASKKDKKDKSKKDKSKKSKKGKSKKDIKTKYTCPADNGEFGECDDAKHAEACEDCPKDQWNACEAASGE